MSDLPRETADVRPDGRVKVPCDCGDPSCSGWMMIPGPDMLKGPTYRVPSGLTRKQLIQWIDDCAAGKIAPTTNEKSP